MTNHRLSRLFVAALVVPLALVELHGASSALAQAEPDEIRLLGLVRDFRKDHDDFDKTPDAGFGHCASNATHSMAGLEAPGLLGSGFLVGTQWRDSAGENIAPHLFHPGAMLKLETEPDIGNDTVFDSYDAAAGPYGVGAIGDPPPMTIGNVTPPVVVPDIGASIGDFFASGAGSTTISADMHCDNFELRDGHEVTVSGHRTIVCDGNFTIRDVGTVFALEANASLSVYLYGSLRLSDEASINTPGHHGALMIYNVGTKSAAIKDGAEVAASIISPDAPLILENVANFYGTFAGETLTVTDSSGLHIAGLGLTTCGAVMTDTEGSVSTVSTGGITDADSFGQWFTDEFGTNLSQQHWITLSRNDEGVYEYMDDEFFPIDDRLFGNEDRPHNYLFTYAIEAEFTYEACSGQFLEMMGSDDIWVYFDDDLVIDLGGMMANTWQRIDLDRAGLEDGQTYSARIYYAQRQHTSARFRLRSTVELTTEERLVSTAAFD
ncbi:MAG: fibro-slime domain-containing protein [Planctomycetota bacterium]|jgi:fibro-slime domain-containing protein